MQALEMLTISNLVWFAKKKKKTLSKNLNQYKVGNFKHFEKHVLNSKQN